MNIGSADDAMLFGIGSLGQNIVDAYPLFGCKMK
jgi:hypothetical protein